MQYTMNNSSLPPLQKESLLIKPPIETLTVWGFCLISKFDIPEPNVLYLM